MVNSWLVAIPARQFKGSSVRCKHKTSPIHAVETERLDSLVHEVYITNDGWIADYRREESPDGLLRLVVSGSTPAIGWEGHRKPISKRRER